MQDYNPAPRREGRQGGQGRPFENKSRSFESRSFDNRNRSFDSRASEGRSFENRSFNKRPSEGRSFEGRRDVNNDRSSEWRPSEGRSFDKRSGEGRSFEGRRDFNNDRSSEWRPSEGRSFDKRSSEGRSFDKPRTEKRWFDNRKQERYEPKPRLFKTAEAPEGSEQWISPWIQLKYFTYNPAVFPRMLGAVSPDARDGALINVYDKNGELFGGGFWNAQSRTPLRVLSHGLDPITEADLEKTIERAVKWRREENKLDANTNAYRVIHGDSDGIGGLIVDRYADVLSLEVTTLGVWKRLDKWLPRLHELCGTERHVISVDEKIARMEGIDPTTAPPSKPVRLVRIEENGVQYEVDFAQGHKTGFFCDQRDNRAKLAKMVKDKSFLDLCCYSGGFSISAKLHGGASEVTAVDLDEKAIAMAKRNANINNGQLRIDFVHADAFVYARQMVRNGKLFDVVLLDPPKFIMGRDEEKDDGIKKYHDLNMLGLQCVRPGGLFVTCSCSGLLHPGEFERTVIKAAQRLGRRLQILEMTGPGWDHPFLSTYPEGRYLKVLWARVMP